LCATLAIGGSFCTGWFSAYIQYAGAATIFN